MRKAETFILGGGVTGLAAGLSSGLTVLEARDDPGGICSSYYIRPGEKRRLSRPPRGGEVYRFEIGGGHWIFGGDPATLGLLRRLTPFKKYTRRSSVFFAKSKRYVPYPIQHHLGHLGEKTARIALLEIEKKIQTKSGTTLHRWLEDRFGPTLCRLFFHPFHERYTAGLWRHVAAQDDYKSPVHSSKKTGYNVTYLYPKEGLNALAGKMAEDCKIRYGRRVVNIDLKRREVCFEDGSSAGYGSLISTLPLNELVKITGLSQEREAPPYTSVLVLNIGAVRGAECPEDHWVYFADSDSGFHRVGFYSNVDRSFLPRSYRKSADRVSLYAEKAYVGGRKPSQPELERYTRLAVRELQQRGLITETEVVDPTWIEVAYTWNHPKTNWRSLWLARLAGYGIHSIGRYGAWNFQGIADSVRDGLKIGRRFKRL